MKHFELSPFTGHYHITYPGDSAPAESRVILEGFLEKLAEACISEGAEIIGHIKLLAMTPEGAYFRGSLTSTRIPADVEAMGVDVHRSLDISLVVLVYGLEKEKLEGTVLNEWSKLMDTGSVASVIQLNVPEFHPMD